MPGLLNVAKKLREAWREAKMDIRAYLENTTAQGVKPTSDKGVIREEILVSLNGRRISGENE